MAHRRRPGRYQDFAIHLDRLSHTGPLSPLLLIFEPTAWPNRTVNVIPADSVDCLLRKKLGATLESDCWSPDFEQPKDASNSKVRKIVSRRCTRTSLRNSHPTVAVTGAEGAERP